MSAAAIAANSVLMNNTAAASRRAEERKDAACRESMPGYSHHEGEFKAMQGYAQCVQRLYPAHEVSVDGGFFYAVGLVILGALIMKCFEVARNP